MSEVESCKPAPKELPDMTKIFALQDHLGKDEQRPVELLEEIDYHMTDCIPVHVMGLYRWVHSGHKMACRLAIEWGLHFIVAAARIPVHS